MKFTLVVAIVLTGQFWRSTPMVANDNVLSKPVMADSTNGWWQQFGDGRTQILHTTDGGRHWMDVSPAAMTRAVQEMPKQDEAAEFLPQNFAFDALNAQSACVAFTSDGGKTVVVEHTADAGQHWRQNAASLSLGEGIDISFVDEEHGFLLTMGGVNLGPHVKRVYCTTDGGKNWYPLAEPPGNSFIPSGIAFRNVKEGWITGEYRGNDDRVLCRTTDGGKSWTRQAFKIPDDAEVSYANTYPPVFVGVDKRQGYLPVEIVRNDSKPSSVAWVTYETDDGGATWHVPASGIQYSPR